MTASTYWLRRLRAHSGNFSLEEADVQERKGERQPEHEVLRESANGPSRLSCWVTAANAINDKQ